MRISEPREGKLLRRGRVAMHDDPAAEAFAPVKEATYYPGPVNGPGHEGLPRQGQEFVERPSWINAAMYQA